MPRVDIRGVMIPNDYKWFYDWFEEDSTCPRDVQNIIDSVVPGDEIEVYINSPGGVIDVGSEIYTMLRQAGTKNNVKIYVVGEACSAASVVSMAGYCEMAPTALMMVHCVSTSYVSGNHSVMEHTAEMLREADKALCTAYMNKTGMSEEEALEMMENETWLTAAHAKERGLVDAIMFENNQPVFTNAAGFKLPSQERMDAVRKMMDAKKLENEMADFEEELKFFGDAIKNTI